MPDERNADPYRTLGVPHGATEAQIKAAHRRLAKRWHPDAPEGETVRFLAIQEAYHLLMDPLRRKRWDDAHAATPVRATDPAGGRATRPGAGRARGAGKAAREARARATPRPAEEPAGHAGTWGDPDRAPGMRTGTWSASGVPWWEDFRPRTEEGSNGPGETGSTAGAAPNPRRPAGRSAERPTDGPPPAPADPRDDPDVYSRSSGAAWSMAARRHFRRGDEELPRGGSFRRRGSGYVLGAEARRLAAEEAAAAEDAARRAAADDLLRRRSPGRGAPRTTLDHEPASPSPAPREPVRAAPPAPPPPPRPAPAPDPAPPATAPAADGGTLLGRLFRAIGRG